MVHLPRGAGADCIPSGDWDCRPFPTRTHILARFCPAPDSWLSLSAENLRYLQNALKVGVGSHGPTSGPLVSHFTSLLPPSEDHQGRTLCLCFQHQLCVSASAGLLWEQTNLGDTAQKHRPKDIPLQSVATRYFRHRIQKTFRYKNQNGHIHSV